MTTLAQTVADPPTLQHLLLENPWPVFIALIGVAAVMRTIARRHDNPRLNLTALIAVVLAIGVVATAHWVTTTRERLIELTEQFVAATADPVDTATVHRLLDPYATISGPGGEVWVTFDQLRDEIDTALDNHPIDSHHLDILGAAHRGDTGHTQFSLRTTFTDQALPPQPTTWLVTWRRDDADAPWRIQDIRWLWWANRKPPRHIWR